MEFMRQWAMPQACGLPRRAMQRYFPDVRAALDAVDEARRNLEQARVNLTKATELEDQARAMLDNARWMLFAELPVSQLSSFRAEPICLPRKFDLSSHS